MANQSTKEAAVRYANKWGTTQNDKQRIRDAYMAGVNHQSNETSKFRKLNKELGWELKEKENKVQARERQIELLLAKDNHWRKTSEEKPPVLPDGCGWSEHILGYYENGYLGTSTKLIVLQWKTDCPWRPDGCWVELDCMEAMETPDYWMFIPHTPNLKMEDEL